MRFTINTVEWVKSISQNNREQETGRKFAAKRHFVSDDARCFELPGLSTHAL